MINRMKNDITKLNNKKIGKELTQYTIAPVIAWIYVWIMNIVENNDIAGEFVLGIMFFTVVCGFITVLIARKNKIIFILFKVISIWIISLAFLSIAYTSYYIFLKLRSLLFVYITIFIYMLIFISMLVIIGVRVKAKIKKDRMNKTKTVLLGSPIFFIIGYFIIEPIVKKSGQFTIHVTIICFCLLICYILVACSSYYLVEYMISKQLHKK